MSDYVLFHLWSRHRQYLVERHEFYLGQAGTRLLAQFGVLPPTEN